LKINKLIKKKDKQVETLKTYSSTPNGIIKKYEAIELSGGWIFGIPPENFHIISLTTTRKSRFKLKGRNLINSKGNKREIKFISLTYNL